MSDGRIEALVEEEMLPKEILNERERVTDISRKKREEEWWNKWWCIIAADLGGKSGRSRVLTEYLTKGHL